MILGLVRTGCVPGLPSLPQGLQSFAGSVDGRVSLAFAGRVYSYQRGPLSVLTESFGGECSAEVTARAYSRLGHGCLAHVPGRFRFILYDAAVGQLFAASSTVPPWPLAYWSKAGTTVVCSRLLPMLHSADIPRVLDESYLVHLVMGLAAMREGSTPLRDVRRLCPGEALLVDSRGARVLRVDHLAPREPRADRATRDFVETLGAAVGSLAKQGNAAVSLSGGLDSAALVGAGLRHAPRLRALTFIAPALAPSAEVGGIAAMASAWPHLHIDPVDASDAADLPDLGPELRDDPPLTPLALLPARLRLWSKAREAGARTMIEGEGSDELFSALPTPFDALRNGHVIDTMRHVMGASARRALARNALVLPWLPGAVQRAWLARRQPLETQLPAFAAWDAGEHPLVREAAKESLATLVHRPFAERVYEWLAAPIVVGAHLSRRGLATRFGLELEWPMLDRSVLEAVLGLHAAGAVHGGPHKPFLRAAVAGIVPDEVRLRPKDIGLYKALIPRVLTSPRSREALRDTRVRARLADLVRFDRIDAMLDCLAAGRTLGAAALWQLECVVGFADWYARASREYGVD